MKVKIVEHGWGTYTGPLRGGMFVNGVCEDMAPDHARALANILKIETEDGKNPSSSQELLDNTNMSAPVVTYAMADESVVKAVVTPPAKQHTQAELEAIADAKGIDGLREIAAPMNIKGTSIVKLIATILEVQKQALQPKA
jgi:hypothetical protein